MPIPFQCPHCGIRIHVEDRYAGQTGPCRQCGQTVTIPELGVHHQAGVPQPVYHGPPCPRCESTMTVPGPWPWYLGTLGAIFVSAKVCRQCGHEFDARKPQADFKKRKFHLTLAINGFGAVGIIAVIAMVAWVVVSTMR